MVGECRVAQVAAAVLQAFGADPLRHRVPLSGEHPVQVAGGDEARPGDLLGVEAGVAQVGLNVGLGLEEQVAAGPGMGGRRSVEVEVEAADEVDDTFGQVGVLVVDAAVGEPAAVPQKKRAASRGSPA